MSNKLSFAKLKTWFDNNQDMLDSIVHNKKDGLCIWIENNSSPIYYSDAVFDFSFDKIKNDINVDFYNEKGQTLNWNNDLLNKILFSNRKYNFTYKQILEEKTFTYNINYTVYKNASDLLCIIFTAKLSHNSDFISLKNPKLYYELFDSSEELIGISNLMGRFTAINKTWIEKTGYTKDELKNTYLLRLIHKDDRTETNNEFKKLYRKQSRVINCQSRIMHKNGSVIWLEWNAVYDKELGAIYTVARDITEKKNKHIFKNQSSKLLVDLNSSCNLSNHSLEEFLFILINKSIELLKVDRLSIWSYNTPKSELTCKYFKEINKSNTVFDNAVLTENDLPIYFKSVKNNKVLSVTDARSDERTSELVSNYFIPFNIFSMLDVQIVDDSGFSGVICAEQCDKTRKWSDEEAEFMYSLSEVTSRAIANNQLIQSQKKLNDTISQLSLTIEAAKLGLWEIDRNGIYSCNNYLKNIFNIDNSTEITSADTLSQYVLPEDLAIISKLFSIESNNKEVNSYRYRILTPAKKLKYLLGFAKRINDDQGNFLKWNGVAIDITELTQSQIALKENEERLKFTLNSINDLIMILDTNGVFIEFYVPNTIPKWVFKDPYNFVGKHFSELKSDSFKLHLEHLYNDYEEFSDYKQFDYRIDKNDFSVWLGANASIRYDNDNNFIGVTVVSRDVSVRKAIEAALNDEKNKVTSIIEGTNVGTWQWNIQTGETEFNERWAEIVGYQLEELEPTTINTWANLCHPDDNAESERRFENHFAGKSEYYHIEFRMRHKNGQWVWVLARGRVSEWDEKGNPLLMYGTHQDITLRKYTELAMLKLSNELATLNGVEFLNETCKYLADTLGFDFAFVGKINDEKTHIDTFNMYTNGIFIEPLSYELNNTPCHDVVNGDICIISDNVANIFPEDIMLTEMGIRSYAGVPLLNKNGTIKGLIVLLSKKKTENKQLVDAILSVYRSKVSAELDRIEAEEKLEVLIDTTKRQNDRLRHFSFITSHNIRSSVSNILGLTDILGESLEMADSMIPLLSIATKNLDTSIKNANQLLQLEEKLDSTELSECNIAQYINNILTQLEQRIKDKGISIIQEIDPNLTLFTNPAYLESVLYNLISNASKYGVSQSSNRIIVRAFHSDNQTTIEVEDFGQGLSNQRDIERIFELGTRLHNTEDGQGFGLFMTKHQVEIMGGTITVISEKDKGSIFRIHIDH